MSGKPTKLQIIRLEKGLLQLEVSQLLGIPPYMLSKYERGWEEVPKRCREKLSRILQTPEDELFENK